MTTDDMTQDRLSLWPEAWSVADEDLLASASSFESRQGRVIRVRTFNGWDVELLPDRCLDIGIALHGGAPISWVSPVRDRRPIDNPRGDDWLSRFHGGLLTTCGLRGFGPARDDRGLHGNASHLPAGEVAIRRNVTESSAQVSVSAEVLDARIFDATLRLSRTVKVISHRSGHSSLEVVDELRNLGPVDAPIGMLYHINLGAPLLVPGARIRIPAETAVHREPGGLHDPALFPGPTDELIEHVVEYSGLHARDERGRAHVVTPSHTLTLDWSAPTLPHLVQWAFPTNRRWALGLEPATSSLIDEAASLEILRPDEARRHDLRLTLAGHGTPEIGRPIG